MLKLASKFPFKKLLNEPVGRLEMWGRFSNLPLAAWKGCPTCKELGIVRWPLEISLKDYLARLSLTMPGGFSPGTVCR